MYLLFSLVRVVWWLVGVGMIGCSDRLYGVGRVCVDAFFFSPSVERGPDILAYVVLAHEVTLPDEAGRILVTLERCPFHT